MFFFLTNLAVGPSPLIFLKEKKKKKKKNLLSRIVFAAAVDKGILPQSPGWLVLLESATTPSLFIVQLTATVFIMESGYIQIEAGRGNERVSI